MKVDDLRLQSGRSGRLRRLDGRLVSRCCSQNFSGVPRHSVKIISLSAFERESS